MSKTGDTPYRRAYRTLIADIRDGTWHPGARIPSEHALAERYQVSRHAVTWVTTRLRWVGLITGKPGGATYVAAEPMRSRALALIDQMREIRRLNRGGDAAGVDDGGDDYLE